MSNPADYGSVIAFIGIILGIISMQAAWSGLLFEGEKGCIRALRRAGAVIITASFGAALYYAAVENWQPELPTLALMTGVTIVLLCSAITALIRHNALKFPDHPILHHEPAVMAGSATQIWRQAGQSAKTSLRRK
jgi:prepilin signal peptidase PulO-like enzyme (type II secretory pathway)